MIFAAQLSTQVLKTTFHQKLVLFTILKMFNEDNFDILSALVDHGLVSIAEQILEKLGVIDLKCCQLVCSSWNYIVESLFDHSEWQKLGNYNLYYLLT